MTKDKLDEVIGWLMDNPCKINGNYAYLLQSIKEMYFE